MHECTERVCSRWGWGRERDDAAREKVLCSHGITLTCYWLGQVLFQNDQLNSQSFQSFLVGPDTDQTDRPLWSSTSHVTPQESGSGRGVGGTLIPLEVQCYNPLECEAVASWLSKQVYVPSLLNLISIPFASIILINN